MSSHSSRRGPAARACALALALTLLEGCASTVHVLPSEYPGLTGQGKAVISMRDGRVYEFHRVTVDSSRFVGQVDVVRNVVGRDGHLDALEDVEEVRLPFGDVESVELRHTSLLATAALLGATALGIGILIRQFQPEPTTPGTGGGGGGGDNSKPQTGSSGR